MHNAPFRASRGVAIAALLLTPLALQTAQAGSRWLTPGTPEFEVVKVGTTGADVRAAWTAPRRTSGVTYFYRGGTNAGTAWTTSGSSASTSTVLAAVPAGGSYWFCVTAKTTRGYTGNQSCASFVTPAAAAAPTPPPAPSAPVESTPDTSTDTGHTTPIDECAASKPEWIWCDDFEADRIASYFESSLSRQGGVGVNGSTAVVGRYLLGSSEAGNLKLAFGRTPSSYIRPVDSGSKNYREIYWRVYLKHPADWQGGGADKLSRAMILAGSNWQQAALAHVWSGTDPGPQQNFLKIDPASGTDASGTLQTTRYNDTGNLRWLGARASSTPLFDSAHLGQWHCVEARVRLNDAGQSNGVFQLWVNDVLNASRTDLNWVGAYDGYGLNAVFLENYWNAGSPVEQERYMDNFVVSTARIGC